MLPRMTIDLARIRHNAETVVHLAHRSGLDVYGVVKGVQGDFRVVSAVIDGGVIGIADSNPYRLANIKKRFGDTETFFIRLPMISEAMHVVRFTDMSMNSELSTIKALNNSAGEIGQKHRVMVMVDIGDLREGVPRKNAVELCRQVDALENIELYGLAVNFACYSGLIPEPMHFAEMERILSELEAHLGRRLHFSAGNSANINLLLEGTHPQADSIRVGEAILNGTESLNRDPIPDTYQDAFKLYCEIIEVKEQETVPWGHTAQSGFGEKKKFVDRGRRKKAIAAIGMESTEPTALEPTIDGVEIIGSSSDHMMMDITDAVEDIKVGDVLEFNMAYTAVMRGMVSPYLRKEYIDEDID